MLDVDVAPMLPEIFSNKTAVAMMWLFFAAEKTTVYQRFLGDLFLDASQLHESEKSLRIGVPRPVTLLVVIQHLLCRSKIREVDIIHSTNMLEEVDEILLLGKSRQLRHVIEPHVYDAFRPASSQRFEEGFRALLGEADREEIHVEAFSDSRAKDPSTYAILASCFL